jgi:hypothetical protein
LDCFDGVGDQVRLFNLKGAVWRELCGLQALHCVWEELLDVLGDEAAFFLCASALLYPVEGDWGELCEEIEGAADRLDILFKTSIGRYCATLDETGGGCLEGVCAGTGTEEADGGAAEFINIEESGSAITGRRADEKDVGKAGGRCGMDCEEGWWRCGADTDLPLDD